MVPFLSHPVQHGLRYFCWAVTPPQSHLLLVLTLINGNSPTAITIPNSLSQFGREVSIVDYFASTETE